MPLPLPDLDTRRWTDLVEEGVALVPRYAPEWTDHNVHDPGITLIELLAWLVEHGIYRANRIPDRHRRKFLALVGFPPAQPRPARAVLGITLAGSGPVDLPAGLVFQATPHGRIPVPFTSTAPATLVEGQLVALQTHDGSRFVDRTPAFRDDASVLALGPAADCTGDPDGPALYLGFDKAWPPGIEGTVFFDNADADTDDRARLLAEEAKRAADCSREPLPCPAPTERTDPGCHHDDTDFPVTSPGGAAAADVLPPHHSVQLVWEFHGISGWQRLDASVGDVSDDTRSLTLDGPVRFRLPGPMTAVAIGAVTDPLHWVRARIVAGRYDAPPSLRAVRLNPVFLRQTLPATERFVIAKGTTPSVSISVGLRQRLDFEFGDNHEITALDASSSSESPEVLVIDYEPATATEPGSILLPVRRFLDGSGLPEQHASLADVPVADGVVDVRSIEKGGWRIWDRQLDLDASGPTDAHCSLDATGGEIEFGDGVRGRVPPAGAPVLGGWSATLADEGNLRGPAAWTMAAGGPGPVAHVGGLLNRALFGMDPAAVAGQFGSMDAAAPARGGRDEETIGQAASRAAAFLWAHEWLLELCRGDGCETLDQLDADTVRGRAAPVRAVTAADYERIALDVPGTRIRRARAWPGVDARYACLDAPGTITVVIVPESPAGRPAPTAGLIRVVRRYLERRRTLCTRVVVTGPVYRVITVAAVVRSRRGADANRVRHDVVASLTRFLDPLTGGPSGHGWPFGRDVYRTEVLHALDDVAGVDHVVSCVLSTDAGVVDCGNVCLGPIELAASGAHEIRVVQP